MYVNVSYRLTVVMILQHIHIQILNHYAVSLKLILYVNKHKIGRKEKMKNEKEKKAVLFH